MSSRFKKLFTKRNVILAVLLATLFLVGCGTKILWEYYKYNVGASRDLCEMPSIVKEFDQYYRENGECPDDYLDIAGLCVENRNRERGDSSPALTLRSQYRFTGDRNVYCVHNGTLYRLYVTHKDKYKDASSSRPEWIGWLFGEEFCYAIVSAARLPLYYGFGVIPLHDSDSIIELKEPIEQYLRDEPQERKAIKGARVDFVD